jgi:rhodanese-related sulfurtransferase
MIRSAINVKKTWLNDGEPIRRAFMRYAIMLSVLLLAFAPFPVLSAGTEETSVFDMVFAETSEKEGVKEITYEQFMRIKAAGSGMVLLDVLGRDSFEKEHIEGSLSLPVNEITEETAKKIIPEGAGVIVYCGGFKCTASTKAALKLSKMGYKVLDYKGGLQEWEDKGNTLVK